MSQIDPLYDDDLDRASWTQDEGDRRIWMDRSKWMQVQRIDLREKSPFLTIWTQPRQTIRAIVETDPTWLVAPLVMLAGVAQALLRASTQRIGDRLSLRATLTLVVVTGPLAGFVGLQVAGWLLALTGRWLGGRARPEQVRAAIAWSSVPTLASLPIGILLLAVLGREMFTTKTPTIDAYPALGLLLLTGQVVAALLRGWSVLLLLKCVGEVQGFSAWRTSWSLVLTGLVVVVPIGLLMIVVFFAAH